MWEINILESYGWVEDSEIFFLLGGDDRRKSGWPGCLCCQVCIVWYCLAMFLIVASVAIPQNRDFLD